MIRGRSLIRGGTYVVGQYRQFRKPPEIMPRAERQLVSTRISYMFISDLFRDMF